MQRRVVRRKPVISGKHNLHTQGRRVSQGRSRQNGSACRIFHPCFLPGLIFDPEDEGDICIKNIGFSELHGRTTQKTALFSPAEFTYIVSPKLPEKWTKIVPYLIFGPWANLIKNIYTFIMRVKFFKNRLKCDL
jgi:hypothetical protein